MCCIKSYNSVAKIKIPILVIYSYLNVISFILFVPIWYYDEFLAFIVRNTDHSCLFLRRFLPNITAHAFQTVALFLYFYDLSLKTILFIVLEMLNFVRYEYYGICWKHTHAICVGCRVRKNEFDINKLLFYVSGVFCKM